MSFPDHCLRGIRIKDWILPDGKVAGLAFEPDKRTENNRQDGFIETSIAWEDDNEVIVFCFERCKNNFLHGTVRLPKKEIDHVISLRDIGRFSYERKPLPENKYHGNLLYGSEMPTRSRRLIESALSLFSSKVIPNKN